jgi:hypothetical protein
VHTSRPRGTASSLKILPCCSAPTSIAIALYRDPARYPMGCESGTHTTDAPNVVSRRKWPRQPILAPYRDSFTLRLQDTCCTGRVPIPSCLLLTSNRCRKGCDRCCSAKWPTCAVPRTTVSTSVSRNSLYLLAYSVGGQSEHVLSTGFRYLDQSSSQDRTLRSRTFTI